MQKERLWKILFIVSTLRKSGPINQLYGLVKYLNRSIFEPVILTLSPEPHPSESMIDQFKNLQVQIFSLGLSRSQMLLKGKEAIIDTVNKIKPDFIHTHGFRPDFYVSKYLSDYSQCNTIHNYAYADYPLKFGKLKGLILAWKHVQCIKKIKYPISCSYSISNQLKVSHHIETATIQNGIDTNFFSPINNDEKEVIKKQLGLESNKKIFLFVGALSTRKDPLTLIKGFNNANISQKATLVLLGDGPLRQMCEEFKGECVFVKGNVSNVIDYLRVADVFVSASKAEGLPMAVLEAIGTGLPVVLSNIEPHLEVLQRNNAIGESFSVGDVEELSKILKNFLDKNLARMGTEARKVSEEYFSAKVMSYSYQEFYKEILNGRR